MKSRKGVALLITLMVVATMIALIGITFGYLDKARDLASYKSALIESDYLFTQFSDILRKNLGRNPTLNQLKGFYSSPLNLSTKNREFDIMFFCEASSNRIPFAWLAKKGDNRYQRQYEIAQKVFDELVVTAGVKNPQKLKEMIVSALSSGYAIRYGISSLNRQKKDIISKNILIDILSDYRFLEDDDSVWKIEWDKYFSYEEASPPNRDKIDAQFASATLLAIIFDMDVSYIEDEFETAHLDKFMKESGLDRGSYSWLFANGSVADMVCSSTFKYLGYIYNFEFQYRSGNIKGFNFAKAE